MLIYERTSSGDYIVHYGGYPIGHVGKVDNIWHAKTSDFDLGEHKTRREAVEALIDIYTT